jgi:Zn-dependent protease with chaperone function
MVHTLDTQELETVLAHELAHHARRDSRITWWALLLRDAFCYLPTSRLIPFRNLTSNIEMGKVR